MFSYFAGLTKQSLAVGSNSAYWKLIDILAVVELSHFKTKSLLERCPSRSELPPEYFLILAQIHWKRNWLLEDALSVLRANLTRNTCEYALIHTIMLLSRVQLSHDDAPWFSLIQKTCGATNERVQDEFATGGDLVSLLSQMDALGGRMK
jgi:hypothetical protein